MERKTCKGKFYIPHTVREHFLFYSSRGILAIQVIFFEEKGQFFLYSHYNLILQCYHLKIFREHCYFTKWITS